SCTARATQCLRWDRHGDLHSRSAVAASVGSQRCTRLPRATGQLEGDRIRCSRRGRAQLVGGRLAPKPQTVANETAGTCSIDIEKVRDPPATETRSSMWATAVPLPFRRTDVLWGTGQLSFWSAP